MSPQAFSPGSRLGREALQAWANGDVAETQPMPAVVAPPLPASTIPRPAEGSGAWRMLRRSLRAHWLQQNSQYAERPARTDRDTPAADTPAADTPVAVTSPDLPVAPAADARSGRPGQSVAETRTDLPAVPAEDARSEPTRMDLPAQVAPEQTRPDLPAQAAAEETRTDLPAQADLPAQVAAEPTRSDLSMLSVREVKAEAARQAAAARQAQAAEQAEAGEQAEAAEQVRPGPAPEQTRADLPVQSPGPERPGPERPGPEDPGSQQPPQPRQPPQPPQPRGPEPHDTGYTRLMAQAVASAVTTPFPAVAPNPVSDAARTFEFPAVPAQHRSTGDDDVNGAPAAAAAGQPEDDGSRRWRRRKRRIQPEEGGAPAAGPAPAGAAPVPPPAVAPESAGGAPWAPAPSPPGEMPLSPRPYVAGTKPPAAEPYDTGADQSERVFPAPRSPAGQRPSGASARDKDLARRSCLRLRCVCPDPTVCPALSVKRSPAPAPDASRLGWQMPAEEQQPPSFAAMMSLAVASAATMPIPIMPGGPGHGFATAATMPLPVVPPGSVPWQEEGRNPVAKLLGRLKADHMLRNTLFLLLSTGLQAALGFAFWIVVARVFNTADVGRGSSLISAIGLIAYFALLGLNSAVVRFLPTAKDKNSLITSTVLVVGGFGALLGAAYIFATPVFAPKIAFVAHQPLLALGFVVLAGASAVNLLTDSVFIASRKANYTALTDGGVGGASKIVFAVLLTGSGAYGVFSASAGGFAAAALASLVLLAFVVDWRPTLRRPVEIMKPLIKFSFANYAGDVMGLLPTLVVPLIILDRLGASAEAYSFVAFQLANLLYAAGRAIEQTFLAEGSQANADWHALLRRSLRLLVVLFMPMCLVVVASAHWVLLAFGVRYSQFGTPTLMLLAAAAVPMGANNWLQTVLRLAGALKAIVWSGVVSAISVCALAWFLAPYGLTALSASWVLGTTLGAVVAGIGFVAVRRRDASRPSEPSPEIPPDPPGSQPQRSRRQQAGKGRGSSSYEGRHGPRSAQEKRSERPEQPVG